jgi:hypothetical protein
VQEEPEEQEQEDSDVIFLQVDKIKVDEEMKNFIKIIKKTKQRRLLQNFHKSQVNVKSLRITNEHVTI